MQNPNFTSAFFLEVGHFLTLLEELVTSYQLKFADTALRLDSLSDPPIIYNKGFICVISGEFFDLGTGINSDCLKLTFARRQERFEAKTDENEVAPFVVPVVMRQLPDFYSRLS